MCRWSVRGVGCPTLIASRQPTSDSRSIYQACCLLHISAQPRPGTHNIRISSRHRRTAQHFSTCVKLALPDQTPRGGPKLISANVPFEDWPTAEDVYLSGMTSKYPDAALPVNGSSFPSFVRSISLGWHYCPKVKHWVQTAIEKDPGTTEPHPLKPGAAIRVVTWNMNRKAPWQEKRIIEAIDEIKRQFDQERAEEDSQTPLVIMLQEVRGHGLWALRTNEWIRRNFYMSEAFRGLRLQGGRPAGSQTCFVGWSWFGSVCLTLTSRKLPQPITTFVQFGSWTTLYGASCGKEVVLTDLPVQSSGILRLANTHFNAYVNTQFRIRMLREVSLWLDGADTSSPVVAGILAGDLNIVYNHQMQEIFSSLQSKLRTATNRTTPATLHKPLSSYARLPLGQLLYQGHIEAIGDGNATRHVSNIGGFELAVDFEAWALTPSQPSLPPFLIRDPKRWRRKLQGSFSRVQLFKHQAPDEFYSLPLIQTRCIIPVSDHVGRTSEFKLLDYTRPDA